MKRQRKKAFVSNPLANATGKQYTNSGKEFTLDTSKIPLAKLQQLAKPTKVELQLQKVEMPELPEMLWIGYSPSTDYHTFGTELAKQRKSMYHGNKDKVKKIINGREYKTRQFTYNGNNAWRIFSRDYYPQKITNLYKNINDWFELQFRAKVQDIANTRDKTEKAKKEQELKKYLVEDFLQDQIGTILTEAETTKEEVMKCIESFVLNPQIVLNHQYAYFNSQMQQEATDTAAKIKEGINSNIKPYQGRGDCTGAVNEEFSSVNGSNRVTYNVALKELPTESYLQVVNDNIDAAFKYIDSFDSTEVSNAQTDDYTDRLGTFNIPDKDLGGGGGKKKSDLGIILAGVGILTAIFLLKRRMK